jgi:hypothetical protein
LCLEENSSELKLIFDILNSKKIYTQMYTQS